MKKLTLLMGTAILAVCLIILSCRKEINSFVDQTSKVPPNILESSRIFYESKATLTESLFASAERKLSKKNQSQKPWRRKFVRLTPQWKKAKQLSLNGRDLLVVPTVENRISSSNIAVRRFFIFDLTSGRASDGEIVELVGVNYKVSENLEHLFASYKDNVIPNFTGAVLRYDLNYYQKSATVFENGRISTKKSQFKRSLASKKSTVETQTSQSTATSSSSGGGANGGGTSYGQNGPCTIIYWYTWQEDENGNHYNETWTILGIEGNCSGTTPPGGNTGNDSNSTDPDNTSATSTDPYTGGGGGGYGGNEFTTTLILGGGDIIQNVTDYLKCFNTSQAAVINIYVDQPTPNSSATWAGNPFDPNVGHTFISIEQNGITRVIGFYPGDTVNPGSSTPTAPSVVRNDGGHGYDVKVTTTITGAKLNDVLHYIKTYPTTYNLNTYNCTDFGIGAIGSAGVSLPDHNGTWPGGGGSNPGNLGEDIRGLSSGGNLTVKKTGGNSISNTGSCN